MFLGKEGGKKGTRKQVYKKKNGCDRIAEGEQVNLKGKVPSLNSFREGEHLLIWGEDNKTRRMERRSFSNIKGKRLMMKIPEADKEATYYMLS